MIGTGIAPRPFRLSDPNVCLESFEPGQYWVLFSGDYQGIIEVVVGPGDVHGVVEETYPAHGVPSHRFVPMDEIDPEVYSEWAGPLPSPEWTGEVEAFDDDLVGAPAPRSIRDRVKDAALSLIATGLAAATIAWRRGRRRG